MKFELNKKIAINFIQCCETFCECKGYGGIKENGVCFKCDKPLDKK